jgi:hypothetical protein
MRNRLYNKEGTFGIGGTGMCLKVEMPVFPSRFNLLLPSCSLWKDCGARLGEMAAGETKQRGERGKRTSRDDIRGLWGAGFDAVR